MSLFNNLVAGVKKGVLQHRFDVNLSEQLDSQSFVLKDLEYFGLPDAVAAVAHDPLQGILAVGTSSGSIHLFGREFTSQVMALPKTNPIRFMRFKSGSSILIVIDAKNILYTFNLVDLEKDIVFILRTNVTCIDIVPSMDWLFVGMGDGCVDVFDLDRGLPTRYRIPNLWQQRLDNQRRMSRQAYHRTKAPLVIDMQWHPRLLDQILIAYPEGVVLYDIKAKAELKCFELILPPYAPGGGNDSRPRLQIERRAFVTTIFWKGNGLGFVAGYDDGCFAFWDIANSEKPLMVRTMTEENVNLPLSPSSIPASDDGPDDMLMRDPIFRLAMCTYEKEDVLVIAGGLTPADVPGLQAYHFSKEDPINPRKQKIIPLTVDVSDFVLLPRVSPWLGLAQDAHAIFVVAGEGSLLAYDFPRGDPPLILPPALQFLHPAVTMSKLYALPRSSFLQLTAGMRHTADHSLRLHGGRATPLDTHVTRFSILITAHDDGTIRFWDPCAKGKYLQHLTVDVSKYVTPGERDPNTRRPRLPKIDNFDLSKETMEMAIGVANGEVLILRFDQRMERRHMDPDHPSPILELPSERESIPPSVVPVETMLSEIAAEEVQGGSSYAALKAKSEARRSQRSSLSSNKISDTIPPQIEVPDDMENPDLSRKLSNLSIASNDNTARRTASIASPQSSKIASVNADERYVDLAHKADWSVDSFKPVGLLKLYRGDITALRVSDIGFIAVGFEFQNLTILDLRGPTIVHCEDFSATKKQEGQPDETSCVPSTLEFVISYLNADEAEPRVRLIAGHRSGITGIYTLAMTSGRYVVIKECAFAVQIAKPVAIIGAFVVNLATGIEQSASPEALADLQHKMTMPTPETRDTHILCLVTGSEVRVHFELSAQRVFKAAIDAGEALTAQLVTFGDSPCVAVLTSRAEVHVFSLPKCEPITKLTVPFHLDKRFSQTCITKEGQMLLWTSANEVAAWTFFGGRIPEMPQHSTSLYDENIPLPERPSMSSWPSWLGGANAATTIEQLDDIVGGPDRPAPRRPKFIPTNRRAATTSTSQNYGPSKSSQIAAEAATGPGVFVQMGQYMSERGEKLGAMSSKFDDLENVTAEWARNAKALAAKEAAKKWYQ